MKGSEFMTFSEFIEYHKRLGEEGRISPEDLKTAMLLGMCQLIDWKTIDRETYENIKNEKRK